MADELVCWKCGASLKSLPLPLSRTAECPACKAELHACKLCRFYDARTQRQCTEIRAEEIINKEHANFCDWFKARPSAFDARAQAKAQAGKAKLDALFGRGEAPAEETDPARANLEDLFGGTAKKKE
ncbi:hypothetical protein SVA_0979 [Sulfurifustis variabilis]|uniref:Uncharacterized protein n=1 Tax=Sulfurifustis variabilis TaxID=1675686 RepID=A0A1B4V218_9GAMM|nr:hypothetical protein [Sulfurifustis variabilis]BAU47558.1 hypothetical protein SVA_0979 [Sulfurifustis variabilis]